MTLAVDSRLLRWPFAVIPGREIRVGKIRMTKGEPQARSSDDWRRANQMAAAQGGDQAAYETLLRDCVPLIRAFAVRKGVPPDHIDDVIQDVLLTIHRARQTYDPARSFVAWLRVIAERRAIDLLRRSGRQRAREIYSPLAFESHPDETADSIYEAKVTLGSSRVKKALAALPARQREAVQILVLDERSLTEAAVATRSSKGALKVNLHRALKALRARFAGTD